MICKCLLNSCKNKGVIDTVDLLKNINDEYKYNKGIVINLFREHHQPEMINKLFLQSLGIIKCTQISETLYTMNCVGKLLFENNNGDISKRP